LFIVIPYDVSDRLLSFYLSLVRLLMMVIFKIIYRVSLVTWYIKCILWSLCLVLWLYHDC